MAGIPENQMVKQEKLRAFRANVPERKFKLIRISNYLTRRLTFAAYYKEKKNGILY